MPSESQPMFGKKFSKEHKQKLSGSIKLFYESHNRWSKGLTKKISESIERQSEKIKGINNPWYKKKFPGLKCEKCGKGLGKNHNCINPMLGQHHSIKSKKLMSLARLNRIIPSKDTSIEIKIQKELLKNNINFEKHKVIENFVQCDIFIKPNIIIFVDGCYWHGCHTHYPDRTKLDGIQNKNVVRDVLVNQFFNNLNGKYIVLRFWEHEIKNDLENCGAEIVEVMENAIQINR